MLGLSNFYRWSLTMTFPATMICTSSMLGKITLPQSILLNYMTFKKVLYFIINNLKITKMDLANLLKKDTFLSELNNSSCSVSFHLFSLTFQYFVSTSTNNSYSMT